MAFWKKTKKLTSKIKQALNMGTDKKAVIKRLDILWSKYVKLRMPVCIVPNCNKPSKNAHHIFTRSIISTRWYLGNGVGLCLGHHIFLAHKKPEQFRDIIMAYMGEESFKKLKFYATNITKYQVEDLLFLEKLLQKDIKEFEEGKK